MGKMIVRFPCLVCKKPVAKNHEAICCENCNWWVHRHERTSVENIQRPPKN